MGIGIGCSLSWSLMTTKLPSFASWPMKPTETCSVQLTEYSISRTSHLFASRCRGNRRRIGHVPVASGFHPTPDMSLRRKAQSRFAPARCAGASAERPVVGRERTAIAWWQGQHDQQARTVGVQRVIRIARRPAGHHADAPSDNDRSGAAMAKLP